MNKLILISLTALLTAGCKAQEKSPEALAHAHQSGLPNKPEGSWKVTKEVDKDGNLIRYDSIYSWSSSDGQAAISPIDTDSILRSFQGRTEDRFPFGDEADLWQPDSLLMKEFFNLDLFQGQFGRPELPLDLEDIQKQLDSVQRELFEHYRGKLERSSGSGEKTRNL